MDFPEPLKSLSLEHLEILELNVKPTIIPAGTRIFAYNDPGDYCYIIDKGQVRLEVPIEGADSDEPEKVLKILGPGDLLGEIALLDRMRRSASAFAHTEVRVRRFDVKEMDEIAKTNPDYVNAVYAALGVVASRRLRQITKVRMGTMRAVDIIVRKRDGFELSKDEIEFFVKGYTDGDIPDYQASAWAMAVLLNGMSDRETTDLTLAMANSGDILDLSGVVPLAVDKHSTGGVGDKVTFVVLSLASACGLAVGKMSGRGLGFSGGTLDKIESIPGYRVDLSLDEFKAQLQTHGIVLTGQSAQFAPADGKFYALRDVTGTVQSLPLIASSVMSKKIAAGAQAIVLDVKTGVGAFMETLDDARKLANIMVNIGKISNRQVVALISDMNQPLGSAVGNALELREAVETLQGKGPADFHEHCLVVASHMVRLGQQANTLEEARKMVVEALESGTALEKFRKLVAAQGGDVSYVDDLDKLPQAALVETIVADRAGCVCNLNAREVGETAVDLGAGRAKKGDAIDHAVGIMIHVKVGDVVAAGDPLFTVHANDAGKLEDAKNRLMQAYTFSDEPCDGLPLFYDVIGVS